MQKPEQEVYLRDRIESVSLSAVGMSERFIGISAIELKVSMAHNGLPLPTGFRYLRDRIESLLMVSSLAARRALCISAIELKVIHITGFVKELRSRYLRDRIERKARALLTAGK